MTSTDSLATRKPTRRAARAPMAHYVWWLLRRYAWLALLGAVSLSALTWVMAELALDGHPAFALSATSMTATPLRLWAIVFGVLCGFVLYGFLWSRRECGMYLTLSVGRVKQFSARYLFGVGSILLSVAIPLTVAYLRGIARIGGDVAGACLTYTVTFGVSLLLICLLSFAVSVAVSVLCGRFLGALLSLGGVLALPYALLWAVQTLIGKYLLGCPLGTSYGVRSVLEEEWIAPNLMTVGEGAGLFTMLEKQLRLVTIRVDGGQSETTEPVIDAFGQPMVPTPGQEGTGLAEQMARIKELFALPVGDVILLTVVLAILAVLTGLLFWRRRAEVSGQVYVCPALAFAAALAAGGGVGAFVLGLDLPIEGAGQLVLSGILFVVAVAAVTAAVLLILTRSRRVMRRAWPAVGGTAAMCCLLAVLLGSGWFGYAARIPAAEDIAEVSVSYNQNHYYLNRLEYTRYSRFNSARGAEGGLFREDDTRFLYTRGYQWDALAAPLTDPADIALIRDIHAAVVADGLVPFTGRATEDPADTVVSADYLITYTLKDGSKVVRYYECLRLGTLERTMDIEETDTFRALAAESHAHDRLAGADLWIGDEYFASLHRLELTTEEKRLLYAALDADYAALTPEERYHPAPGDILGVIRERTTDFTGRKIADFADERNTEVFYITRKHANTCAFLEERGLLGYFDTDLDAVMGHIRRIEVQPYTVRFHWNMTPDPTSHLFLSCEQYDQLDHTSEVSIVEVPRERWEKVLTGSVPVAYLSRPAELVLVTYETEEGRELVVTRVRYRAE